MTDLLSVNYLQAVARKTAARYWQIAPHRAPANLGRMLASVVCRPSVS